MSAWNIFVAIWSAGMAGVICWLVVLGSDEPEWAELPDEVPNATLAFINLILVFFVVRLAL